MAKIGNHASDHVAYQLHNRDDLAEPLPCKYAELLERPRGWDYGRADMGIFKAGWSKPAVTIPPPTFLAEF